MWWPTWWAEEVNKWGWWCQRVWRGNQFVLQWPTGMVSALQGGFMLLVQIQLLKMIHVFKVSSKPCHFAFQYFLKLQIWIRSMTFDLSLKTSCKSVFARRHTQTNQSCTTTMWGDWISSFWNHLLKWVLAIDRKLSHSLKEFTVGQSAHSAKRQRHPETGLGFDESGAEKVNCLRL